MIGELVGAGVALSSLYLWGWRRFRFVHTRWRSSQRDAKFEEALRRARAEASTAGGFRLANSGDLRLSALLSGVKAESECAGFLACGLRPLGDLVADSTTGVSARAAMRVLVDDTGTVCASVGVTTTAPENVRVAVSSYADSAVYVTSRGPQATLAEPPFVTRRKLPARTPHADLLAKHRALVAPVASELTATRTSSELVVEITRLRAEIAQWREAQPPDALLDADLRNTLGSAYPRTAHRWAHRLRSELPQAQALSRKR